MSRKVGLSALALLSCVLLLVAGTASATDAPDPEPTLDGLTGAEAPESGSESGAAAEPSTMPAPSEDGARTPASALVVLLHDDDDAAGAGAPVADGQAATPAGRTSGLGLGLLDLDFLGLFREITVFMANDAPSPGRLVSTSMAALEDADAERGAAVAGAATAIGLLSLLGAWLRRTGWLGAALPLFSRIEGSQLLKHPVRAQIVAFVGANPGANVSEIARELDLAWGTATHHLDKLARDGLVVVRRLGNQRCFFEPGAVDRREMDARSALKGEVSQRIAAYLCGRSDVPQKTLADELGLSRAAVSFHVRKMADRGVLVQRRDGRSVHLTLTASAEEAVRMAGPAAGFETAPAGPSFTAGSAAVPS